MWLRTPNVPTPSGCPYPCSPRPRNLPALPADPSQMPVNRKTWSSWNFLGTSSPQADTSAVCVSYWVNRLQELPPGAPNLFVTLNPITPPAPDTVIRRLKLAHPVFRWAGVWAAAGG